MVGIVFRGVSNSWFRKRRLEIERFFFVTFVVLDTQIERLLRNARIIAELIRVHAALKLARKLFMLQVHQSCQREIASFEIMQRILDASRLSSI
jgi:hypothetical protein